MTDCSDCFEGFKHEGIPEGKLEDIGGVTAYVAVPGGGNYPKDMVILQFPDVFGLHLVNSKLLADDFARNGWKTVIPDLWNSDSVAVDAFNPGSDFDFDQWFLDHAESQTRPTLDKMISALKQQGVVHFFAVGYCYGCRFIFDLAFENTFDAVVANHPSRLEFPQDYEKYAALSKAPLLINSCPFDKWFLPESRDKANEILGGGKFAPGYQSNVFEGCIHGFAVRGDLSDPMVKAGKEGAFTAAVEWFRKSSQTGK